MFAVLKCDPILIEHKILDCDQHYFIKNETRYDNSIRTKALCADLGRTGYSTNIFRENVQITVIHEAHGRLELEEIIYFLKITASVLTVALVIVTLILITMMDDYPIVRAYIADWYYMFCLFFIILKALK